MSEMSAKQTIIIVDDEDMVLTSLRSFLSLETEYTIVTFQSPVEALEYIKNNPFHLVISDYLMPDMNGLEFLAEVRAIRPNVPRVILTGYADKQNAIKAINTIGLYQYIEKPWSNDDLLIILRNGLEKQNLLSRLNEKINEIKKANNELLDLQTELVKTFV